VKECFESSHELSASNLHKQADDMRGGPALRQAASLLFLLSSVRDAGPSIPAHVQGRNTQNMMGRGTIRTLDALTGIQRIRLQCWYQSLRDTGFLEVLQSLAGVLEWS
jgi:hypothetical protein